MTDSLIIDVRRGLRWHQRLLSDASTAILWSGWLCLWLPLVRTYASLAQVGSRATPDLGRLVALASDDVFGQSLLAVIAASGALLVWKRLPARRAFAGPAVSVREYALVFGLPEHDLRAGREAGVCVVHHDEHGRIVRLEPPPRLAARVAE